MRALLFRSYVIPHFTYACEVTPYTRKQILDMNRIICQYARRSTGSPMHACTNVVLREAGLRPLQYDFLQARMSYYVLLMSRQESHMTRVALEDLKGRVSTSVYSKWHKGIITSFDKLACAHLLNNVASVAASKDSIKRLVNNLWLTEGGASIDSIEARDKFTAYLRDLPIVDPGIDVIHSVNVNVLAAHASNISLRTQVFSVYTGCLRTQLHKGLGIYF